MWTWKTRYPNGTNMFKMVNYNVSRNYLVGPTILFKANEIFQMSLNNNYKEYLKANHMPIHVNILI